MAEVVWEPVPGRATKSAMEAFRVKVEETFGIELPNYESLHNWSIVNRSEFWGGIWDFCEVVGEKGQSVLEAGDQMPGSRWFPNATLSFAENLLRRADESPAVIFVKVPSPLFS